MAVRGRARLKRYSYPMIHAEIRDEVEQHPMVEISSPGPSKLWSLKWVSSRTFAVWSASAITSVPGRSPRSGYITMFEGHHIDPRPVLLLCRKTCIRRTHRRRGLLHHRRESISDDTVKVPINDVDNGLNIKSQQ